MSPEENKAVVVRFNKEFIEGGDLAVLMETLADDFVNHDAHPGMSKDRDGAMHFFTKVLRPAFPDLRVTILDQVAEGDRVVTRKSYRGTHQGPFAGVPATGRQVEFGVIDILRLSGGKYVEHWAVADMAGLRRQLTEG